MYCNLLKDFLNEKGVEYTAIDVAADEEAREYVVEGSGQMGVPVTEFITRNAEGEDVSEFIVGFDEQAIVAKLKLGEESSDQGEEDMLMVT